MKKVVFVFMFLFLFMKPVYAEEANISYERLNGIYYNQLIDGRLDSNHVTSFHLGDRIAYCIEPGLDINTNSYSKTDWSVVNLSDDIKEYIEKIGYYGYEYPGHQNNLYYIAAQELIWKAVRPDMEITWSTGKNKTGDIIDVSLEKSEIESLANSHSLFPSFALKEISGYVGDEVVVTDENNVLNLFEISESENNVITKEGNVLKIKLNKNIVPSETITLRRRYYDSLPLIIYAKGNSQKLAALRITSDKNTYFTVSNIEKPIIQEEVEVPNTGIYLNVTGCVCIVIIGIGMIVSAIKIH